MAHENLNTVQSSEDFNSPVWQTIPARLSNLEGEVKTFPCQTCEQDLTNLVTHDNLTKAIKPLASKNDLEVEIGMVTDSMVKPQELAKLATLEDLEKLSEKVTDLSKDVRKCAKQDDLDKLTAEVNRLSKEVEKCAKQEDLDKLSEEVGKLSSELTILSKKSRKFAKKKHLKRLEAQILVFEKRSESHAKATNTYIVIATGFLAILIGLLSFSNSISGSWQSIKNLLQ